MFFPSLKVAVFLNICIFYVFIEAINYSRLDFCDDIRKLTQCNQRASPSKHCKNVEIMITTEADKVTILDRINGRRNKVASGEIRSLPSANNMNKLRWNYDLEDSAQKWANQCIRGSVPDMNDNCLDLSIYGQNIATVYGDAPGLAAQSLVDIWYMDLLNINSSIIHQFKPSNPADNLFYEHFTQLMWAETTDVGCGAIKFKECLKEGGNIVVYRLVCNFFPRGNILNAEVYQSGPPCTQCPKLHSCDTKFTSLCPAEEIIRQEQQVNLVSNDTLNLSTTESDINDERTKDPPEISTTRDDMLTPYNFLEDLSPKSMPPISIPTTTISTIIADRLKVDELVEMLKDKLSTDTAFRNILSNNKFTQSDGILDAGVEEFVSRIYTSKMPRVMASTTESDLINSTLLADLIEAVIFRNAQRHDMSYATTDTNMISQTSNPIFPKKIKAEMAEVPTNAYFTGHFFIPEELDGDNKITTKPNTDIEFESYGEKNTDVPISDVLLEIENIKRNRATKDFLTQLLETEYATETSENRNENTVSIPDTTTTDQEIDIAEIRKKRKTNKYGPLSPKLSAPSKLGQIKSYLKSNNPNQDAYLIKYSDLLKKLSLDVNFLNLNEKFACSRNNKSMSIHCFNFSQSILLTLFFIINIFLLKN